MRDITLDVWEYHKKKIQSDHEYKAAYDALEQEFSIAKALIKAPNQATRRAMAELEAGGEYSASSVKEFMAALNKDD